MPEPIPFSLSDVTAVADLIGAAEVVAIGENNHHVREFGVLRDRLLRHLVGELGFTVLGFEGGFAEGYLVDAWLRGGSGTVADVARDGFTFGLGDSPEVHGMLTWLREHGGVRFAGLDLPASAGSPEPALRAVRAYLEQAEPAAVSLVDTALAACAPYASVSSAVAPGRHRAMTPEAQDAATAALTVLSGHLTAMTPGGAAHDVACHHAEGALRVDLYLRELAALAAGGPQSSSRDRYLARTVRLLRRRYPGEKIVLMLHNGHLQRVPFSPVPGVTFPSAGTHLAAELGDRYFALALTAVAGTTTGLAPDDGARLGFRMFGQPLDAPAPGGIEAELATRAPCLLDLRPGRGTPGPSSIRHAHLVSPVDVTAAWDAVLCLAHQETGVPE